MAATTTEGTPLSENGQPVIGAAGVQGLVDGQPIEADEWNRTLADLQGPLLQMLLAGALGAITCSASGLAVTIPSGSKWFARQTFVLGAASVLNVPANSVRYVYGCSDGIFRLDASDTAPSGFTPLSAARICKVTSDASTLTLDHGVQRRSRRADPATGIVSEGKAFTFNPATGAILFGEGTPIARPVVTGSRSSGAAWTSLLAALVALGLVIDSTTT